MASGIIAPMSNDGIACATTRTEETKK